MIYWHYLPTIDFTVIWIQVLLSWAIASLNSDLNKWKSLSVMVHFLFVKMFVPVEAVAWYLSKIVMTKEKRWMSLMRPMTRADKSHCLEISPYTFFVGSQASPKFNISNDKKRLCLCTFLLATTIASKDFIFKGVRRGL